MGARRTEGLLVERVEGELLVARTATNEGHALNETAAIVFESCDGVTSRAAIAAEVARRTGLPVDEGIVDLALTELREAGLVELDQEADPGVTRRSVVRRLALPVAAAALLPVVETILLPSSAAAAPPITISTLISTISTEISTVIGHPQ